MKNTKLAMVLIVVILAAGVMGLGLWVHRQDGLLHDQEAALTRQRLSLQRHAAERDYWQRACENLRNRPDPPCAYVGDTGPSYAGDQEPKAFRIEISYTSILADPNLAQTIVAIVDEWRTRMQASGLPMPQCTNRPDPITLRSPAQ